MHEEDITNNCQPKKKVLNPPLSNFITTINNFLFRIEKLELITVQLKSIVNLLRSCECSVFEIQ